MHHNKDIKIICATGVRGEFGYQGGLPWDRIPEDLKNFKKITTEVVQNSSNEKDMPPLLMNAVIMGRKTWESIPLTSRPLPGRFNIVVSSQSSLTANSTREPYCIAASVKDAVRAANENEQVQTIFVIGGVDLIRKCAKTFPTFCKELIHTTVYGEFKADLFFNYEETQQFFSISKKVEHFCDNTGRLIFTTRWWSTSQDILDKLSNIISQGTATAGMSSMYEMSSKVSFEKSEQMHVMPRVCRDFYSKSYGMEHCVHSPDCSDYHSILYHFPTLEKIKQQMDGMLHLDAEGEPSSSTTVPTSSRMLFPLTFGKIDNTRIQLPTSSEWSLNWASPSNKFDGVDEERQYQRLVSEIIATGSKRMDRTQVGTIALFGQQMKFSLRNGSFPLLTTKKMPFGCIAKELLWFISGSTDSKVLAKQGVRIWDANGSREALDSLGFIEREEGDLGPVYGHQWRHFGAKYVDCHTDYTGQGIDQLAECIRKIKETPFDRRIVMSAWNPSDIGMMALPPCHMFCQFFVADGELSCLMYQRSADMGLGVPFNIASYALLTAMIAHVCDLLPGDFYHMIGDAHVYSNHVDALTKQLCRTPRGFPKLYFKREVTNIDDFKFEDFEIEGYNPHPAIAMKMAL